MLLLENRLDRLTADQVLNCYLDRDNCLVTDISRDASQVLPEQEGVRSLSFRERAHLRAAFYQVKFNYPASFTAPLDLIQNNIEAAYHFKSLRLWPLMSQVLLLNIESSPPQMFYQYLSSNRCFYEQIELCEPLIGNVNETLDRLCLNEVGLAYTHLCQFNKAVSTFEQLYQLASKLGFLASSTKALLGLSLCHDRWGKFRKARRYALRCINVINCLPQNSRSSLTETLMKAYAVLGSSTFHLRQYRTSIRYGKKVNELAGQRHDLETLRTSYGRIALAYSHLGQPQHAITYFEKQRRHRDEQQDSWVVGSNALNLGLAYCYGGQFETAVTHLRKAFRIGRTIGEANFQCYSLLALGFIFSRLGDRGSALKHFLRGLSIARQYDLQDHECFALAQLSNLYGELNDKSVSFEYAIAAYQCSKTTDTPFYQACAIAALGLAHWQQRARVKSVYYLAHALLKMLPWKSTDSRFLILIIYTRLFVTMKENKNDESSKLL